MPTRVLLVRHGDTQASQEGRFTGATDVPLSAEGHIHALELAVRLVRYPLDAIFASNMHRAMETAQTIAQEHGMTVTPVPALREVNHGTWDGKSREEIHAVHPEQIVQYDQDPFHFRPEGGESGEDVLNRAAPALQQIVRDHPNQAVLVVAHKTTNRLLICRFVGIDLRLFRDKLGQRPAALNVLEFPTPDEAELLLLNDIGHYGMSNTGKFEYVV